MAEGFNVPYLRHSDAHHDVVTRMCPDGNAEAAVLEKDREIEAGDDAEQKDGMAIFLAVRPEVMGSGEEDGRDDGSREHG